MFATTRALALLCLASSLSCGGTESPDAEEPQDLSAASFTVAGADFPDPAVLPWQGRYYAFATGGHIPARRSSDLHSWTAPAPALRATPAWADGSRTWAPMVLPIHGAFVMYYAAALAGARNVNGQPVMCLSRAVAHAPEGPYDDHSAAPLVCQRELGGSIDPSAYYDEQMNPWLVWKSDGNCCGISARLFSARLSADGTALEGAHHQLLASGHAWERGVIEGPSFTRHNGKLYLFYSGNLWNTEFYSIGYATCASPAGPCTDQSDGAAWLWSDARGNAWGPGGQEWFRDLHTGQLYMSYHAWDSEGAKGKRTLRVSPLRFDARGKPVLTLR
jgi:beta-xylosidase